MKKNFLCVLSLVVSVIALVVSLLRNSTWDVDYPSLLVSVLSVLVTLLIGWNIYTVFDLNSRKKDMDAKIKLVGEQLLLMRQQADTNRGLLEQSISNLYYLQLGVPHPIPMVYFYLSHVIMAITAFSHVQEFQTCEALIKGVKEVVVRPEQTSLKEQQKRELFVLLSCVQDTQRLPSYPDLLNIVARLETDKR